MKKGCNEECSFILFHELYIARNVIMISFNSYSTLNYICFVEVGFFLCLSHKYGGNFKQICNGNVLEDRERNQVVWKGGITNLSTIYWYGTKKLDIHFLFGWALRIHCSNLWGKHFEVTKVSKSICFYFSNVEFYFLIHMTNLHKK